MDKAPDKKNIQQLIELGKTKGFLTYEEVNDFLPSEIVSSDEIDDLLDVLVVPYVVPGGDHVYAEGQELLHDPRGDGVTAGGVFAVGDDEIRPVALPKRGEALPDDVPPGFAHDIAYGEDGERFIHDVQSIRTRGVRRRRGFESVPSPYAPRTFTSRIRRSGFRG